MPDFTLSVTADQAQRIAAAFGRYWNLVDNNGVPRDATAVEVKQYLIRQLKDVVLRYERAAQEAAISVPSLVVA